MYIGERRWLAAAAVYLHDVGVIIAAVGEGGLLEVLAAVGGGQQQDVGHVDGGEDLHQVLLTMLFQAG